MAAMKHLRLLLVLIFALLAGIAALAQNDGPGAGQGWLPEFNHSSRQILALAEATPADKFAWRPGAGVRSVSEVYMHIAVANYFLLNLAGVKLENPPKITADTEKTVKEKAEVIRWLKNSFDAVRKAYPPASPQKAVKFFGADSNVENIYLRILVHNHEHMGQSIAYARTNGIVPPWSK
jgi:uncharacterized damage-inducible protein DinB